MKILKIILLLLLPAALYAQDYEIDWFVIGSGGGITQSGSYIINGTIGQPIVGVSTSINYLINAGFWQSGEGESSGYEYLPGDVNMYAGAWEPMIIGADVTYLVNYFRSSAPPCLLDGFFASADVNGDCNVFGSDVTYLVNYFRGVSAGLLYCPDYPTTWPPVPGVAPPGWPNCDLDIITSEGNFIIDKSD